MIIYGTRQCPDTQACLDAFESKGRAVEFRCIENLPFLKVNFKVTSNKLQITSRDVSTIKAALPIVRNGCSIFNCRG